MVEKTKEIVERISVLETQVAQLLITTEKNGRISQEALDKLNTLQSKGAGILLGITLVFSAIGTAVSGLLGKIASFFPPPGG